MGRPSARSDVAPGPVPTAPASGIRGPYPANEKRRREELARAADYSTRDRCVTSAREAAEALRMLATALHALRLGHTAARFDAYALAVDVLGDALTVLCHALRIAGEGDRGILFDVRAWLRVPDPAGAASWAVELEGIAQRLTNKTGGHRG